MSRLAWSALAALMSGAAARAERLPAYVSPTIHHDVSPPLWLIRPAPPTVAQEHEPLPIPRKSRPRLQVYDPVLQSSNAGNAAPPTATTFEAVGDKFTGPAGTFAVDVTPPDSDGAVGPTDYVSLVNSGFAVFDKTGAALFGPVQTNTLFAGFGGECETDNDGDGIVLYDRAADRWFLTQFAISGFVASPATSHSTWQCVAVSKTGDPTGQWYRYAFEYRNVLNDYGKFGVWPDGYYVTYNTFDAALNWAGGLVCAFDRASMLLGNAATQQCVSLGTNYGGLLPSDLDGDVPPAAGEPNFILGFDEGPARLHLWKFHVDWNTSANSALTGPTDVGVADFTLPCGDTGGTCIAEAIPAGFASETLDSLGDRLMFRLSYRNFGDHESLVTNHTVTVPSTGAAGVRWYELRDPNGTPTLYQQGTYAPDASFRWMGSIATDRDGNIALGYNVSDSTHAPSLNYAGRLAGDPLGLMAQGEARMFTGTGSEVGDCNGKCLHNGQLITRWGDYSSMTVDPTDDCTFWFVGEYLATNGQFNWHTRVGHFKFPGCGAADFSLEVTPPSTGTLIAPGGSAQYAVTTAAVGGFAGTIAFRASGLPASVHASFSPVSVVAGGSSTLTLTADSTPATVASTTFAVTGTSGSIAHGATSIAGVGSDFGITVTPVASTVLAPGGSADYSIDTTAIGGAEAISLSIEALPTGVTGSFASNPVTSGGSTRLTLTAAADAPNAAATTFTVAGTAASGTHTASSTVAVTVPNRFTLALDRPSGAIAPSGTTTFIVTSFLSSGESTEAIALSVADLPAGVTGSFAPATIHAGDTSMLTLTADATATIGAVSTFLVSGTSASDFHSTSASLAVVRADFALTISPPNATIGPGGHQTYSVTATARVSAPAGIKLSMFGTLPAGVSASSFSSGTIDPGGSSSLTLTAASSAPMVSDAQFFVLGIDGDGVAHLGGARLTIGNDFGLALSPATAMVVIGHPARVTVSSTVVGTAESVSLAVAGLPNGLSGSFDPGTITAGGSSTLTLTAAANAAAIQDASYTVSGSSPSATHTATGALTVAAAALPTASVTAPANGAKVSGTVDIEATAAPGTLATLVSIELKVDDAVVATSTVSPAKASWQSSQVPDGTHTITARVVDSNQSSNSSPPVVVTVSNGTGSTSLSTSGGKGGCASASPDVFGVLGLLAMAWTRRRLRENE